MKSLLFPIITFTLLLSGCTSVGVVSPLGEPISDEDAKDLVGLWVDSEEKDWMVAATPDGMGLIVKHREKGEVRTNRITLREIERDVFLLWYHSEALDAHFPLRVLAPLGQEGLRYLNLLLPDDEAVEEMLKEGQIQGRKHPEEDAWILDTEGLEAILAGKEFWRIDTSILLMKKEAAE